MNTKVKRATVYLDFKLHQALKIKAVQVQKTISELVNIAIKQSLREDLEDLSVFKERKNEPDFDFEIVLKELMDSGRL